MTRKALGRGLSALLSNPSTSEELKEVDIDLIDPNPEQPRTSFPEEKLEELAASIKANGLVQPILLRRLENGRYQIIAGERRWRATQRAGLLRINAVIKEVEDEKLLELALIENIQRQELSPIEEARSYQKLIETLAITQEEVAKRVGKDRSSITNFLRLLKLPEKIHQKMESYELSMGHARALLSLDSIEEQNKVADEVVRQQLSVRETERLVQKLTTQTKTREISTTIQNDANIRAAELKLKRYLGTQVRIKQSEKGGKIEIEFSSASDLDRIYTLIMHKSEQSKVNHNQ